MHELNTTNVSAFVGTEKYAGRVDTPRMMDSSSLGARHPVRPVKPAFHDTDTDFLARILADTSDTRG